MLTIPGIHHITAIASDPQRNVDFYALVLGLKLIKITVNFDDPGTYHLYYGNAAGTPGSILTFFPWPGARPGRHGTGQAVVTGFRIPAGSMGYWRDRLHSHNVTESEPFERFGHTVLAFSDPDGLQLELIESGDGEAGEHAILGFYNVTLSESGYEATAKLLDDTFDFHASGEIGNRFRFAAPSDSASGLTIGTVVDLLCQPDARSGMMGAGTVHHVAFRAQTDEKQRLWREQLTELGFNVTPVLDRQYFHSIYFHEPGGVLFEIATDPPGFAIDEPADKLGTSLKLPPWLEPVRPEIERKLPKLRLPGDP